MNLNKLEVVGVWGGGVTRWRVREGRHTTPFFRPTTDEAVITTSQHCAHHFPDEEKVWPEEKMVRAMLRS